MGVRVRRRGGKKAEGIIKARMKLMQSLEVDILGGIPRDTADYPDGESVAVVGAQNEFGVPSQNIPERSFLRSTLEEKKDKYKKDMTQVAEGVIKRGRSARQGAGLLGQQLQGDIQKKIVAVKEPPNSPMTIKKKKSSNPLIDTGHMIQSIRYEVRKRGASNA